jgi:hypothetical protein
MWGSLGSLPDVFRISEKLKGKFLQRGTGAGMKNANQPSKPYYNEQEAADVLGISLARLRLILDQNIFNDGMERPEEVLLQPADLILVSFWDRSMGNPKVVRMPRRR